MKELYVMRGDPTTKILVDWSAKKVVKNGLAKGTLYKTYLESGEFSFWRSRKEIQLYYEKGK